MKKHDTYFNSNIITENVTAGRKTCLLCVIFMLMASFYSCLVVRRTHLMNDEDNFDFGDLEDKEAPRKQNIVSKGKMVLIVAYMRSGSTLTGSILESYQGTFYVFEPLRVLAGAFGPGSATFKFVDGTERTFTSSEKSKLLLDELKSWFSCKMNTLTIRSLTNKHNKQYTRILGRFYDRALRLLLSGSSLDKTPTGNALKRCLKKIQRACKNAPLRVIKVIRLPFKEAVKLLPLLPDMKIIHLVRDPRGIINSRLQNEELQYIPFEDHVKYHCAEIERDLQVSKEIQQTYSDRIKLVRYEDIADGPIDTARSLFEFVKLPFAKAIQDLVYRKTHAKQDSDIWGTLRQSSQRTASKWRLQLKLEMANYIFDKCNTSNYILGYLPLPTIDALRNQSIPSKISVDI